MSPDLEQSLFRRYASLFNPLQWPSSESAMSRGCECGDGWYGLLDALCEALQWEAENVGPQPVVVQVKAKLGSLRVYLRGASEVQLGMVRAAERISTRLCENCGYMCPHPSAPSPTSCPQHGHLGC